jgi:hypothetical protein
MRSDFAPSIQTVINQVELLANNWQRGDLRPISIYILGKEDTLQLSLSWIRDQIIECEVEQLARLRIPSSMKGQEKNDLLSCVARKMIDICGEDRYGEIVIMPQRGGRFSNGEIRFCVTVKTTHYVVHSIPKSILT